MSAYLPADAHAIGLAMFETRLREYPFKQVVTERCLTEDEGALRELKEINEWGFFTPIDKAPNTLMLRCTLHERYQCLKRLDSADFEPWDGTLDGKPATGLAPADAVKAVKDEIHGLIPELDPYTSEHTRCPNLSSTVKMHKKEEEPKHRWLEDASDCIFTPTAKCLQQVSALVVKRVKTLAKEYGIELQRRFQLDEPPAVCPMVNDGQEVALNLPKKATHIWTGDASRCYETIPVLDRANHGLQYALEYLADKAFSGDGYEHITVTYNPKRSRAKWGNPNAYGEQEGDVHIRFDKERFLAVSKWLMGNAIVQLGDRMWHQVMGIPMGFSVSVDWCDGYLFSYEYKFFERVERLVLAGTVNVIIFKWFVHYYRLRDDFIIINGTPKNPKFLFNPRSRMTETLLDWIYPTPPLKITCELTEFCPETGYGIGANFLNFALRVVSGMLTFVYYKKRRHLGFKTVDVADASGNREIRSGYDQIISQLTTRVFFYNSTLEAAALELDRLVTEYADANYARKRLIARLRKYLESEEYPPNMLRFNHKLLLRYPPFTTNEHGTQTARQRDGSSRKRRRRDGGTAVGAAAERTDTGDGGRRDRRHRSGGAARR
jgi:hypothetical protein